MSVSEIEKKAICDDGEAWKCKHCGAGDVWYTTDETLDGAYDIYRYHCHSCGKRWRVVDECD